VTHMADLAIRLANQPRTQAAGMGWEAMFTAGRK
jgi:hypothetical protein